MAKEGKSFEADMETSAKQQGVFYFRVRDVNPMAIKKGQSVPKNRYDALLFYKQHLLPVEMKSTKSKSISFDESIIKDYQIKSLQEAAKYNDVIPGFLFNFREPDNRVFFVHIDKFIEYKHIAENRIKEHTYASRVNKSSIPIGICEEIGVEVKGVKKKVNYRWYINRLIDELIVEGE